MSDGPSIQELIDAGERGDTKLEIRLTARELAAVQYLIHVAERSRCVVLAAALGGRRWSTAFAKAQARLGIALADAFAPEHSLEFVALLAELDQMNPDDTEEDPDADHS